MSAAVGDLERAAALVHEVVPPTPQIRWPLLCEALGTNVWVKHENHGPVGAFKLRGGLVYVDRLLRRHTLSGLITATRGNHGQSIAFAGAKHGLPVTVVAPHGNSREKNAAMRALGATLVEYGDDFQSAREHAQVLADRDGLHTRLRADRHGFRRLRRHPGPRRTSSRHARRRVPLLSTSFGAVATTS